MPGIDKHPSQSSSVSFPIDVKLGFINGVISILSFSISGLRTLLFALKYAPGVLLNQYRYSQALFPTYHKLFF